MRPSTPSIRVALSRATNCIRTSPLNQTAVSKRTFTSLPTLRPTILPKYSSSVFRSSTPTTSLAPTTSTAIETSSGEVLDIVSKSAITTHPSFGGLQVRCGPRPTMARSSRLIRKRRHGFLSRVQSRTGRRTLQRRRTKGRHSLSQ
ncbi:hypothetical protein BX600DRAFT_287510 [Xylariales sp. PMI_506]|nr:hypothetical protein BX600DRAFT_287510 [Xylariales sp. PMI_506]